MSAVLIIAEHAQDRLNASTARCVSCAQQLLAADGAAGAGGGAAGAGAAAGTIDIAVLAADAGAIAAQAAALGGVRRVITVERA